MYQIGTLSHFPENLVKLLESIRRAGEKTAILVADDGLPTEMDLSPWAPVERIVCPRMDGRFNFARNANAVLRRANSDIFLVNDDAELLGNDAPVQFLESRAAEPDVGIVSAAVVGFVGNPIQAGATPMLRDAQATTVCFVAVYLSRRLQDQVGMLDERFNGYGYEDADYSARSHVCGLKNLIDARCMVRHENGSSSFRREMGTNQEPEFRRAARIFAEKWIR